MTDRTITRVHRGAILAVLGVGSVLIGAAFGLPLVPTVAEGGRDAFEFREVPVSSITLPSAWKSFESFTDSRGIGAPPDRSQQDGVRTAYWSSTATQVSKEELSLSAEFVDTLWEGAVPSTRREPPDDCRVALRWDRESGSLWYTLEFVPTEAIDGRVCACVATEDPLTPEEIASPEPHARGRSAQAMLVEADDRLPMSRRTMTPALPGSLRIDRDGSLEFGASATDSLGKHRILLGRDASGHTYFWVE